MGGVSTSLLYLVNALKEYNAEVEVVSLTVKQGTFDSHVKTIPLKGLKRYWVFPKDVLKHEKGFFRKTITLFMMAFKWILKKNWTAFIRYFSTKITGYDIAVAYRQSESTMSFVLDMVQAKKKLVFIHGNIDFMPNYVKWGKKLIHFDQIICVAEELKRELIQKSSLPESKVSVINNLLDREKIIHMAEAQYHSDIDVNYPGLTFVTVARLDPIKGIDRIVEICTKLAKHYNNQFRWLVVGGGDLLPEYCRIASEPALKNHLYFLGEYKNPFPIIKSSDLFILTSLSEGYPLVILESMLLKVPAIVTNYPAAPEQIQDGINGFIVENSIEGLENKLIDILEHPFLIDELREALMTRDVTNDIQHKQVESVFELTNRS